MSNTVTFILNSECYSLYSVLIESISVFDNRNSKWATNSDKKLEPTEYRTYDHKYDRLRRLGFSCQLFIINYIYAFSLSFLNYGLSTFVSVSNIQWFDPYFYFNAILSIFGNLIRLGFFFAIAMSVVVVGKYTNFWTNIKISNNIRNRVRLAVEKSKKDEDQGNI